MSPSSSEHGVLPLAPIERPPSLFVRLLFWGARRRYGTVPVALRVIYARAPFVALASLVLLGLVGRCRRLTPQLRALLQVHVANSAGCTFCADIGLAEMVREGLGAERFAHLHEFESSDAFEPAEKAALAYASAVGESLHVPDAVFERLRLHFDERGITEIVWLCAVERYLGSMALPLRLGSDHLAEAMRRRRPSREAVHALL